MAQDIINIDVPGFMQPKALTRAQEYGDEAALATWLSFVSKRNAHTHRSYQNEVMRFWAFLSTRYARDADRSLAHLLRDASEDDVQTYEMLLLGPERSGETRALFISQADMQKTGLARQPFVKETQDGDFIRVEPVALKPSSVNQALAILHALYQYWMLPDPVTRTCYVWANPVRRLKRASNRMQRQAGRNFPSEAITAMMHALALQIDSAQAEEQGLPQQIKLLQRRRWIVAALFGLWTRRAELASISMGDFKHNGSRWMLNLTRKGGKEQVLPVAPWVMDELARYRISLGKLSALPRPTDKDPAIEPLRKRAPGTGVSGGAIYREVSTTAKEAGALLRAGVILPNLEPAQRERVADLLDEVSPHWFRHSGASIAINSGAMSLENASKMLGHSSANITAQMYYHPDEAQIEEGMQKLGADVFGAKAPASAL